ncbi:MAG: hypothetical protein K6B40_08780 [Firmicutes bacterium]|nr:hypothetical protein [Bacillota bacterium]
MKLKKINAVLSLLAVLTLLIHIGYSAFAYFTFYYNPALKTLTSLPFIVVVCLHAICGMCAVFLQSDGARLDVYRKQNMGTFLQRVSAALIFPLLIVHLKTFTLLQSSAAGGQWGMFGLLLCLQVAFYLIVFVHVAVSFSKAWITLGLLTDRDKQKRLDRLAYILCAVLFVVTATAVVRGQLLMFLPK